MTISQRAIAASQDRTPDPTDRNDQLEIWRIAAERHAGLKDKARRLEDNRSAFLEVYKKRLIEAGMKATYAETEARASPEYQSYLDALHDAARAADDAWIEAQYQDRVYWSSVSHQADVRSEKRMVR